MLLGSAVDAARSVQTIVMRRVLTPPLVIVLAAATLGLSANALRPRDGLELGRAYFGGGGAPNVPPGEKAAALASRAAAEFSLVDTDEVERLLAAAATDASSVVPIDARGASHYREGHLPGALPLDVFNVRADVVPSLPFLRFATWTPLGAPETDPPLPLLVVYCESDECEDGFQLCRILRDDYGIAAGRLRLYLGGMRAWRAAGRPFVRGGRP